MSDVMSVRLHLSGVRVMGVLVDSLDRLEVEVESTRNGHGAAIAVSSTYGSGIGERSMFGILG